MSIEVVQRTFDNTHQRGSYLAALLFLADRADRDGVSWYSMARIADAINLKPRRARQILRTLQERGEIVYAPHHYASGGQTSNRYLVCCGLPADEVYHCLVEHPEFGLSPAQARAAAREVAGARGSDGGPTVDDGGARVEDKGSKIGDGGAASGVGGDRAPTPNVGVGVPGLRRRSVGTRAAGGQAQGQPLRQRSHVAGAGRAGRAAWPDAGELWSNVLVDLEASMPRQVFRTHLLGSRAQWAADGGPVLEVRPVHAASTPWLKHRYQERTQRMVAGWVGEEVGVEFGA